MKQGTKITVTTSGGPDAARWHGKLQALTDDFLVMSVQGDGVNLTWIPRDNIAYIQTPDIDVQGDMDELVEDAIISRLMSYGDDIDFRVDKTAFLNRLSSFVTAGQALSQAWSTAHFNADKTFGAYGDLLPLSFDEWLAEFQAHYEEQAPRPPQHRACEADDFRAHQHAPVAAQFIVRSLEDPDDLTGVALCTECLKFMIA